MFYRKNLLIIGTLLLVIFALAVWLVGIGIERTARQMHGSLLKDVGRYRAELITLDFSRTVELAVSIQEYIQDNPENESGLQDLLRGMVRMDAKISRIWYRNKENEFLTVDSVGVLKKDWVLETTLIKLTDRMDLPKKSCLYYSDGVLYWTSFRKIGKVIVGLDVSLPGLHEYFANMKSQASSYVYILNQDGILLTHPDETRLGRTLANQDDAEQFEKVLRENKIISCSGFSQYLFLPVERVYYPISIGGEKWVVVVNLPELITREEMAGFHRFTIIILIVTVFLFSILLAFSQHRWKKEYDRRRKLEQETMQLNMQQLKNQINPHFLFNSLNSLSALIGTDPQLAKVFVLNLSKIYRYVLEKRNESMVAVNEEIRFIQNYYFLQKIRFQEQLILEWDDKLLEERRTIPLMSLQMLIENAIKHNEITRQYPLFIHIYLKNETVIVENAYHPRRDTANDSLGVGFESIRKIYDYCSDKQFSFAIENGKFVCYLPLV